MQAEKITEQPSYYRHLEQMSVKDIVKHINEEDKKVAQAVEKVLPQVENLIEATVKKLEKGGRLFYLGAGTSGRLGVLDASECPPTYGVPASLVVGLMAGGDEALRFGIEDAEDDPEGGWRDLQEYNISVNDMVIGIAASGTTPYVWGALKHCREQGIETGCIVCNPNSIVAKHADYPIEVIVGPEFVTGSTRMKSGTAQKMVLNMISTAVMIRRGRVYDNRMVHMQISNDKLVDRGTKMLMEKTGIMDYEEARGLLLEFGSVQSAVEKITK
ncbi:N-acetylmuramic acid 6-phosphate etherase [Flavisolibacter tropicus]|uniref:N-acetylmuramic acid 6-phosphate etherase n=1 Tax=Flavisolibacter tropicus TaxID=1492898 RepID=A0A172TWY5_9BACT|nr:N-acetylmuramic acid 6-phosphate etherase [Flavisolibacter tropicus]ANE51478.1 N-acetylmuramic acid-6-phosphate etherase [Flavisolibacter tropicus]